MKRPLLLTFAVTCFLLTQCYAEKATAQKTQDRDTRNPLQAPELAVVAQVFAEHGGVVAPQLYAAARAHLELRGAVDALGVDRGGALGRGPARLRQDERRRQRE